MLELAVEVRELSELADLIAHRPLLRRAAPAMDFLHHRRGRPGHGSPSA
jgi:hypothetical protein